MNINDQPYIDGGFRARITYGEVHNEPLPDQPLRVPIRDAILGRALREAFGLLLLLQLGSAVGLPLWEIVGLNKGVAAGACLGSLLARR